MSDEKENPQATRIKERVKVSKVRCWYYQVFNVSAAGRKCCSQLVVLIWYNARPLSELKGCYLRSYNESDMKDHDGWSQSPTLSWCLYKCSN